ncbi:MAG: D-alanyl-D-alanine carboxypeptidase/D-alanyl-D-alanine-endopeptidase, partial [Marinilabiliaceae bacterium]
MNKFLSTILVLAIMFPFLVDGQKQLVADVPAHASVSFRVVDLSTGDEVWEYNSDKALSAASLMKLVTTATALEHLGPDHTFSTKIWMTGEKKNGVLKGNLVLEGRGDPTLGSTHFDSNNREKVMEQIAGVLRKEGIDSIEGGILVDEHYLEGSRYPSHRLWEDMGNYYGAPPAALSWRDNSFEVELSSPETVGQLCHIESIEPPVAGLNFDCKVRAAAHKKDSAYIYGVPGMSSYEIRGSIPAGRSSFKIKGALPEPGLMLAGEVADHFKKQAGITVMKTNDRRWKDDARLLGEISSPPLEEIIRQVNRKSINLAADHLLISLGKQSHANLFPEWDRGLQFIREFWEKRLPDHYINIKDGSGLAPMNTLSARFLTDMLAWNYHEGSHFEEYKRSFARSGHSGPLENLWNKKGLNGLV